MADRADYYAALGVERDADSLQIKQAYRRLANEHHPDRHPDDEDATRRFQSLVEAYRVLGDPENRSSYDEGLGLASIRVEPGAPLEELVGGVVDQLFGIKERAPIRGRDRRYNLTLELAEAALGCRKGLSLPSDKPCSRCEGRGFSLSHIPEICLRCGGLGEVQRRQLLRSQIEECPDCSGRGFQMDEACPDCQGSGLDHGTRIVEVDVPSGVESGARLKVRGAGEAGRAGGEPGDCIIVLTVRDHGSLRRQGLDIETERPVTLLQATLGAWVEVPSLEGVAKVQVPAGSVDGARLKLSGLGVRGSDGARGDQIVTLTVESPQGLSPEQEAALQSLASQLGLGPFPRTQAYETSLSRVDGSESEEGP